MAKQTLVEWLSDENRDYQTGLDIFIDKKVDPKKNKYFETDTPEAIHKNMLFGALSKYQRVYGQIEKEKEQKAAEAKEASKNAIKPSKNLAESRNTLENIEKEIANGRVVIDKGNKVDYNSLPDDLKSAYDENGLMYPIVGALHAKMKALPADVKYDADRKAIINEALEIQANIKANWAKIDAFNSNPKGDDEGDEKGEENPAKPTGKLTKAEIDAITDPVFQALSKEKRIDANVAYLRRYMNDEKKAEEVKLRKSELTEWEVNYEEILGTNKDSGTGK